jgi:predicted transposase YbfD/YdcC
VPSVTLSSLITAPADAISEALSAAGDMSRCCLRDWLRTVPDPRKRPGRWHPLEFALALAVCAFTAAGHDSPAAIAEWSRSCTRETLALLDGRPDPLTGRIWPPSERTFRRILEKISAVAFNRALYSFLDAVQPGEPENLPDVIRHEREQRRAAAKAAGPGIPGLLEQAACDGKAVRGAVRPDGTRVHLMTAFHAGQGRTLAQHEVDCKSNEIPELIPVLREFNISSMVISADALHGQRDAAEKIHAMGGYYLQFIKGNQPTLAESIAARLTGTDDEFADESWTEQGKGHGRRERRSIRTAPASGIDWPHAEQVMRIRRDSGTTHGPWEHREFALAITNLPAGLAGPRHLAAYARQHWSTENSQHYVRDTTFREDAQQTSTGNQPNALAAVRNLVIGAFRKKGHVNMAAGRRYYGRDDHRILELYGYA